MRWLKVILVSLFLGFYFLSITPIHFYAHSFETDHSSDTQKIDDCFYASLLQSGQGNYFESDTFSFSEYIPFESINEGIVIHTSNCSKEYYFFNFTLRGPPSHV